MSIAELFPALDGATEAALRASIERFGVIVPVVVDQNGELLDGRHRSRIAGELGVEFETQVRNVSDEDEAREIARTLNSDRRHMSIEQRREISLVLRMDGHSARAIAGVTGVSQPQVRKDLAAAQLKTGFQLPDRIVGLDGKNRPARVSETGYYPSDPDSPRRAQMNAKTVRNLNKALSGIQGYCSGMAELKLDRAFECATQDEIRAWERTARESVATLTSLRRALKEAQT